MKENKKVEKTEQEWQTCLTPEQYCVLREKGTEAAFTGTYYLSKEKGMYVCAACGADLFSSNAKFDSGTGWPSFWEASSEKSIRFEKDMSEGMERTEVLCGTCGSHLGHVFDDGPMPSGKRFCINSVALDFTPTEKRTGEGIKPGFEEK